MAEYIEKDKLRLMKTEECAGHTIEYAMGWKACVEWVKSLPAADVRENVKAEWTSLDGISTCPNCGRAAPHYVEGDIIMYWPNLNFCPNCGAKMGGAEDGT